MELKHVNLPKHRYQRRNVRLLAERICLSSIDSILFNTILHFFDTCDHKLEHGSEPALFQRKKNMYYLRYVDQLSWIPFFIFYFIRYIALIIASFKIVKSLNHEKTGIRKWHLNLKFTQVNYITVCWILLSFFKFHALIVPYSIGQSFAICFHCFISRYFLDFLWNKIYWLMNFFFFKISPDI